MFEVKSRSQLSTPAGLMSFACLSMNILEDVNMIFNVISFRENEKCNIIGIEFVSFEHKSKDGECSSATIYGLMLALKEHIANDPETIRLINEEPEIEKHC